jgi:hypothetical protein
MKNSIKNTLFAITLLIGGSNIDAAISKQRAVELTSTNVAPSTTTEEEQLIQETIHFIKLKVFLNKLRADFKNSFNLVASLSYRRKICTEEELRAAILAWEYRNVLLENQQDQAIELIRQGSTREAITITLSEIHFWAKALQKITNIGVELIELPQFIQHLKDECATRVQRIVRGNLTRKKLAREKAANQSQNNDGPPANKKVRKNSDSGGASKD